MFCEFFIKKTDFDLEFFAPKYQFEIMGNTKWTII